MSWKRPAILGGILTLGFGFLALIGVFDIPHTVVIICAIVAIDSLVTRGKGRVPVPWPAPPMRFRRGARTEVARLAWATVSHNGDVSEKVLQRIRALAQGILAAHGVSWGGQPGQTMAPQKLAQQLIGTAAINTLTTTGNVRPRALEHTVSRLEQLRKQP